jgi:hypothetical protein
MQQSIRSQPIFQLTPGFPGLLHISEASPFIMAEAEGHACHVPQLNDKTCIVDPEEQHMSFEKGGSEQLGAWKVLSEHCHLPRGPRPSQGRILAAIPPLVKKVQFPNFITVKRKHLSSFCARH